MCENLHVVPLGDFREHVTAENCWCRPVECFNGDDIIWVHNSMDRRENTIEKGKLQ